MNILSKSLMAACFAIGATAVVPAAQAAPIGPNPSLTAAGLIEQAQYASPGERRMMRREMIRREVRRDMRRDMRRQMMRQEMRRDMRRNMMR